MSGIEKTGKLKKRFKKLLGLLLILAGIGSITACDAASGTFASKSPEMTVIVLDPGHDSLHPGANYHGAAEEDLNYRIAKYCKAELERNGYTVYLTRTDEGCAAGAAPGAEGLRACLEHRVGVAANHGATVMVSLHLNASNAHTAGGAEAYIPNRRKDPALSDRANRVASFVLAELKALGLQNLGVKTRDAEDGSDYYFIIRDGKAQGIPVLIIENAFLDFDADYEAFLSTEEKLRALGEADARGIIRALQ